MQEVALAWRTAGAAAPAQSRGQEQKMCEPVAPAPTSGRVFALGGLLKGVENTLGDNSVLGRL